MISRAEEDNECEEECSKAEGNQDNSEGEHDPVAGDEEDSEENEAKLLSSLSSYQSYLNRSCERVVALEVELGDAFSRERIWRNSEDELKKQLAEKQESLIQARVLSKLSRAQVILLQQVFSWFKREFEIFGQEVPGKLWLAAKICELPLR
jgi:DNA repair exonuclease SbcCD ATPase subunit